MIRSAYESVRVRLCKCWKSIGSDSRDPGKGNKQERHFLVLCAPTSAMDQARPNKYPSRYRAPRSWQAPHWGVHRARAWTETKSSQAKHNTAHLLPHVSFQHSTSSCRAKRLNKPRELGGILRFAFGHRPRLMSVSVVLPSHMSPVVLLSVSESLDTGTQMSQTIRLADTNKSITTVLLGLGGSLF